jgi:hypothetical protein
MFLLFINDNCEGQKLEVQIVGLKLKFNIQIPAFVDKDLSYLGLVAPRKYLHALAVFHRLEI